MSTRQLALLLSLTAAAHASALGAKEPARPGLAPRNRVRLTEAFSVMADVQDAVWPKWSRAPADLVLVDAEFEYLLRSREHPAGFEVLPADPVLGAPVLVRKRTFPPDFLATFPAFGPTPTIVVGTAEATGKASTAWVLSVLHEHFHQLQYSDAGYWQETKALGLAGNDESGMWMLNYPFPYESVSARFAALAVELAQLLDAGAAAGPEQREALWRHYATFCTSLEPQDHRYLSFQLWQEGIARYVELKVAEAAARKHRVSGDFARLPDYQGFAEAAASLRRGILHGLRTDRMNAEKRLVFYAFGAGLGLLLDQEGADWHDRYLREKFYLEKYRNPSPAGAVGGEGRSGE